MAKKKMAEMDYPTPTGMSAKYQIEDDERRLNGAAEVVADRARLKAALKCMRDKQAGVEKLVNVLSGARS